MHGPEVLKYGIMVGECSTRDGSRLKTEAADRRGEKGGTTMETGGCRPEG
jgi:hypothetical protein